VRAAVGVVGRHPVEDPDLLGPLRTGVPVVRPGRFAIVVGTVGAVLAQQSGSLAGHTPPAPASTGQRRCRLPIGGSAIGRLPIGGSGIGRARGTGSLALGPRRARPLCSVSSLCSPTLGSPDLGCSRRARSVVTAMARRSAFRVTFGPARPGTLSSVVSGGARSSRGGARSDPGLRFGALGPRARPSSTLVPATRRASWINFDATQTSRPGAVTVGTAGARRGGA